MQRYNVVVQPINTSDFFVIQQVLLVGELFVILMEDLSPSFVFFI